MEQDDIINPAGDGADASDDGEEKEVDPDMVEDTFDDVDNL